MASFTELVALNNEGDLGDMLVSRFHGEKWGINPRKDSEIIITFKSKLETPSIEEINQAVTEHYTRLGYQVKSSKKPRVNMARCSVFFSDNYDRSLNIFITTFYALNISDEYNYVCITTTFCRIQQSNRDFLFP